LITELAINWMAGIPVKSERDLRLNESDKRGGGKRCVEAQIASARGSGKKRRGY
jgi:hypothetical protein